MKCCFLARISFFRRNASPVVSNSLIQQSRGMAVQDLQRSRYVFCFVAGTDTGFW